jgi:hypothetical protein
MGLRQGSKNAAAARICEKCRSREHTQCAREMAIIQAREVAALRAEGFTMAAVAVPFCACYSETDIHV